MVYAEFSFQRQMGSPAGRGSAEPRLCAILQTCLSMLVPNHKKPLHLTLVGAKLRPRQDVRPAVGTLFKVTLD